MSDDQLTLARARGIENLDLTLACALELRHLGPPEAGCLHPAAALRFLTGGAATFTVLNLQNKQRCTLRVQTKGARLLQGNTIFRGAKSLVAEQTGSDNVLDFTTIGHFNEAWGLHLVKKKGRGVDTITWLREKLWKPGFTHWPDAIRFMHAGRCCRCGRVLTVPESIATGIGPECAARRDAITKPGDPLHGLFS